MAEATLIAAATGIAFGFLVATVAALVAIASAPPALVRTNVSGRTVPAVLGLPVAAGTIAAVFSSSLVRTLTGEDLSLRVTGAVVLVTLVMFFAGLLDDRRGDERQRGFKGHLGALGGGALTGGLIKLVAGAAAGLLAGWVLTDSWPVAIEIALLVALSANVINLLDRAPGRAGKVALTWGVGLLALGSASWGVGAAGMLGALVAVLPLDLKERAMLGDAGANPVGASLGVGLAATLGEPWRLIATVLLLALNITSERVSFSAVIERNRPLRALDRIGRR